MAEFLAADIALLLMCGVLICAARWFGEFDREFFNGHWLTEEAPFNEPPAIVRGIPCEDIQ